ncbi:MAG: hypothetical protein ACTS78_04475 [Arsenophonus sp. NC-WZS1-MAG3]
MLTKLSLNRLNVSDIKAVNRLSKNVNDWDSLLIVRIIGLIQEDIGNMIWWIINSCKATFASVYGGWIYSLNTLHQTSIPCW